MPKTTLTRVAAVEFAPLRDRYTEWQRRLEMIESAKSFLYLTTYFVELDVHGTQLIEALNRAARRGVFVFLGLDGFGHYLGNYARTRHQRQQLREALQNLTQAGAHVARYRPPTRLQRRLGAGQHVKIQLSERGEVIVGSSNLTDRSFIHWAEFSGTFRGPIAAIALKDAQALFGLHEAATAEHLRHLEQLPLPAGEPPLSLDYHFHDPNASAGLLHPLRTTSNAITETFCAAIDRAQSRVSISSFHCKPTEALAAALVSAAQRGVRVELFHSHRQVLGESELPWLSAALEYPRFLAAGIRIYESHSGEHSKLVAIDNAWAGFGSYNFEHAAHERLAELFISSTDARLTVPIDEVFASLRNDPLVEMVSPRSKPLLTRVRHRLLHPWRRWL